MHSSLLSIHKSCRFADAHTKTDSPIRKKRGFTDRAHQNASRTRKKGRFAEGMASYERLVEILEFMYSTYVRINFGVLV